MDPDKPPKKFCAAPWSQGVLSMSGSLKPCCRNDTIYGDFIRDGLKEAWSSPAAQAFRQLIMDGEFPDAACRSCYHNGTAGSLNRDVGFMLISSWQRIAAYAEKAGYPFDEPHLWKITALVEREKELTDEARAALDEFFAILAGLRLLGDPSDSEFPRQAISKCELVGRILYDFLSGSAKPRTVAANRQVQLIVACNARCIHCPGLFSGELDDGLEIGGKRKRYMQQSEAEAAFAYPEDITDFFLNGTEFLAFKGWREVATRLHNEGVKFSLSTNGILLDRQNVDWLFEKHYLSHLNVSMDGATKETLESIRVNVKYGKLLHNLEYLYETAAKRAYAMNFSASFVLMRRNFRELPELFRLLDRLRAGNRDLRLGVLIQSMESMEYPVYLELLAAEHASGADQAELWEALEQSAELSKALEIPARAFYTWDLVEFVEKRMPLPPNPGAAAPAR